MPDTLLLLAITALVPLTLILLRNRWILAPLSRNFRDDNPFISILIPARNEERTIKQVIEACCRQNYPNFEILVLNDRSEDRTPELLRQLEKKFPDRLRVIEGKVKPEQWLGKPWACHQLSQQARGEYFLFIDADVTIQPETLTRLAASFASEPVDMITVWPHQDLESFWEKTVIPLVYHSLLTFLPVDYAYDSPKWMPRALYKKLSRFFAVANGQFIAVPSTIYEEIGGHRAVAGEVVEDLELARRVKVRGNRIRMYEGSGMVNCRMYRNEREIYQGLRKNFFAGFGYRWFPFLAMLLFQILVYLLPFLIVPVALFTAEPFWLFFSLIAVLLILIQRILLARWFGWNPLFAWTHPLGVLWLLRLGVRVMLDRLTGRKALWKGREVS